MIDIHSHILPGIDDGAKTMDDSIAMAKHALEQGVTTIIATPHHMNGKYENKKMDIIHHVNQLNDILQNEGIPVTVLPGQECRIYGDIIEDFNKEEILTMNNGGKYIFIEFSSSHVPAYAEQLLYNIQFEGIIPRIVHPERNQVFLNDPDTLYEYVNRGALTQVTAASVVGGFGKKIQKFSHKLIEVDLTHFIASDAHNVSSRGSKMKEASELIEKKFGKSVLEMFHANAQSIVEGTYIATHTPLLIRKKKFLGLF